MDNNWQDILWANVIEAKHASTFSRALIGFYFVSFFVVMGWFGLNILTALVIETYDIAKSKALAPPVHVAGAGDAASGHKSITAGLATTCLRCGTEGCAVYVPSRYDPNMCQCGHAALYHHPTNRVSSTSETSNAASNWVAPSIPNGGEKDITQEEEDSKHIQAGWSTFQEEKILERSDEVHND